VTASTADIGNGIWQHKTFITIHSSVSNGNRQTQVYVTKKQEKEKKLIPFYSTSHQRGLLVPIKPAYNWTAVVVTGPTVMQNLLFLPSAGWNHRQYSEIWHGGVDLHSQISPQSQTAMYNVSPLQGKNLK